MSHLDLTDGVRYPRGGMYEVIRAFERVAVAEGVEIRTSTNVARIVVGDDGLASGVELDRGEVIAADAVVSGADMHHTETALLDAPAPVAARAPVEAKRSARRERPAGLRGRARRAA